MNNETEFTPQELVPAAAPTETPKFVTENGVIKTSTVPEGERTRIKGQIKELIDNGIDIRDNRMDPRTLTIKDQESATKALNEWLLLYLTVGKRGTFGVASSGEPQVSDLQPVEQAGRERNFARGISMKVTFAGQNAEPVQVVVAQAMSPYRPSGEFNTYFLGDGTGYYTVEEALETEAN